MSNSDTAAKIAVMQAFAEGKPIQMRLRKGTGVWRDFDKPTWNWRSVDYRIAPLPERREDDPPDEIIVGRFRNFDSAGKELPYYMAYSPDVADRRLDNGKGAGIRYVRAESWAPPKPVEDDWKACALAVGLKSPGAMQHAKAMADAVTEALGLTDDTNSPQDIEERIADLRKHPEPPPADELIENLIDVIPRREMHGAWGDREEEPWEDWAERTREAFKPILATVREAPAAELPEFRYFMDRDGKRWKVPTDDRLGFQWCGDRWAQATVSMAIIETGWEKDGTIETDATGQPLKP